MSHDVKPAQTKEFIDNSEKEVCMEEGDKSIELEPVYPSTEAPREKVVAYVKKLTEKASQLPEHELLQLEYALGQNGKVNIAQGQGYDIACAITSATLQDWIFDEEGNEDLADINGIAGQLEITPENKQLWDSLFEKVDELPF